MTDDRKNVCDCISEMLDNPDEHGIYPTTKAYDELVELIVVARDEATPPPEPTDKMIARLTESDKWKDPANGKNIQYMDPADAYRVCVNAL